MEHITVKKYLPLSLKQIIIKNIVSSLIDEETGNINFSLIDFMTEISLLANYTNYQFADSETVLEYDKIKESGMLKDILAQIPDEETGFIKLTLENEIRQHMENNRSLGLQLKAAINSLSNRLLNEETLKNIPNLINKIDPSRLKYMSDMIGGDSVARPGGQRKKKPEKNE